MLLVLSAIFDRLSAISVGLSAIFDRLSAIFRGLSAILRGLSAILPFLRQKRLTASIAVRRFFVDSSSRFQNTQVFLPRSDILPVSLGHDTRNLRNMCQVMHDPGGEQLP